MQLAVACHYKGILLRLAFQAKRVECPKGCDNSEQPPFRIRGEFGDGFCLLPAAIQIRRCLGFCFQVWRFLTNNTLMLFSQAYWELLGIPYISWQTMVALFGNAAGIAAGSKRGRAQVGIW